MPTRTATLIRWIAIPACLVMGLWEFFALLRVQMRRRLG